MLLTSQPSSLIRLCCTLPCLLPCSDQAPRHPLSPPPPPALRPAPPLHRALQPAATSPLAAAAVARAPSAAAALGPLQPRPLNFNCHVEAVTHAAAVGGPAGSRFLKKRGQGRKVCEGRRPMRLFRRATGHGMRNIRGAPNSGIGGDQPVPSLPAGAAPQASRFFTSNSHLSRRPLFYSPPQTAPPPHPAYTTRLSHPTHSCTPWPEPPTRRGGGDHTQRPLDCLILQGPRSEGPWRE